MPVQSFSGIPFCRARFTVDVGFEEFAIHPSLNIVVRSDTGHVGRRFQTLLSLVLKTDFTASRLLANEPALVNKVVVMPAKHYQVVQTRLATIRPVLYVVSVDKSGVRTARKATTLISNA